VPRSQAHAVFSTNRLDGTPTGITIKVVDASADKATIEVTTDDVADPCAEIAPYCGALACTATDTTGECGEVIPAAPAEKPTPSGCGCAAAPTPFDVGGAIVLLTALRVRSSTRRAAKRATPR